MICVPLQTASIVLPKSSNVPSFLSGQEPYLSKLCLDDDIAVTLIILGFFNAFLKNDTQVYECKILSIQKEPAALRKKVSHLSSPGNYFRNCSVKNKSCIKHHKHHSFGVMVFVVAMVFDGVTCIICSFSYSHLLPKCSYNQEWINNVSLWSLMITVIPYDK